MIKRSEVAELEAELRELQVQVPDLQGTVQDQAAKLKDLGDRTPRPEWPVQCGLLPACDQHIMPMSRTASKPTVLIADKLVSRLSQYASQLDVRFLTPITAGVDDSRSLASLSAAHSGGFQ